MSVSRREFVAMLAGLPVVLHGFAIPRASFSASINANDLKVTNYNDDGKNLVTEGKTMLAEMFFPEKLDDAFGSLPVQIEPESAGGALLTEPQPLFFYRTQDAQRFRLFITAPLDVVEGPYRAIIGGKRQDRKHQWETSYFVRRGNYHESPLAVAKDFSHPTPEIAARMRRDFETMRDLYKRRTPRHWSKPFINPVPGGDKHNFGDKRTYNRTKHLRHSGLDYKARMATRVLAINDGIVALSAEQWVPGQTICIDHGGGVFSKYMHLSRRNVSEGDVVKRGDVLALSGNSGAQRTAPHLHLDLVVGGVHVDPKDFMRTSAKLLALEIEEQRLKR